MTITIWETFDSAKTVDRVGGQGSSAEFSVIIEGSDVESDMRTALRNFAPDWYFNLCIQDVSIESQLAPELWRGKVSYGWPDDPKTQEPPDVGDSMWSFSTSGGTHHITQSLETVQSKISPTYSNSVLAPDCKGAIGVHRDGVEGTDIYIPGFTWQETHWLPRAFVTQDYAATLRRLTATTNKEPWRKFKAGEVLFLGANGRRRGRGDWEIEYSFSAEPNITDKTYGGDITGINKKGHEYLWFLYRDFKDENSEMLIKRPVAAYVERIYEESDFADLGINTLGDGLRRRSRPSQSGGGLAA